MIRTGLDLDLYDFAYTYTTLLIERKQKKNENLDKEEQQLFMKSAKEKFNLFRASWKNLLDFEQNETDGNFIKMEKITREISKLKKKIKEFSEQMLKKVDSLEKNNSMDIEDETNSIFYLKLKADYYRYLAEISNEDDFPVVLNEAKTNYENAYRLCQDNILPQDALYLSVVLNYTLFLYFILDDTRLAFGIADKCYKSAISNLLMSNDKDPDVDVLIKRIEENLTIWKIELFDID